MRVESVVDATPAVRSDVPRIEGPRFVVPPVLEARVVDDSPDAADTPILLARQMLDAVGASADGDGPFEPARTDPPEGFWVQPPARPGNRRRLAIVGSAALLVIALAVSATVVFARDAGDVDSTRRRSGTRVVASTGATSTTAAASTTTAGPTTTTTTAAPALPALPALPPEAPTTTGARRSSTSGVIAPDPAPDPAPTPEPPAPPPPEPDPGPPPPTTEPPPPPPTTEPLPPTTTGAPDAEPPSA
jgi:hypothetical protein